MIGVQSKDSAGQLRSFSDIINELGEKWDTLDSNMQHYIATAAAGSRQQSRLLALLNDWSRTQELMEVAENSAGTGARQMALSLDSIETKVNKLKATWQEFTYNFLNADMVKDLLDALNTALKFITEIVNTLNKLPGILGNILVVLIAASFKTLIQAAINYGKTFFKTFKESFNAAREATTAKDISDNAKKGAIDGAAYGAAYAKAVAQAKALSDAGESATEIGKVASAAGMAAGSSAGMAGATAAKLGASAGSGVLGTIVSGISTAIPYVAIAAVVSALAYSIIKAVRDGIDKAAKEAGEAVDSAITAVNDKVSEAKKVSKNYEEALSLQEKGVLRTAEETENYQSILDELSNTYPDLVVRLNDGTLALNTQSDALSQYNEKAKEALLLQQQIIAQNKQGMVKSGVMTSSEGLELQERAKALGANLSQQDDTTLAEMFGLKKGQIKKAEFDKMAQAGLTYESFADITGKWFTMDYTADEFYNILQDYINTTPEDRAKDIKGRRDKAYRTTNTLASIPIVQTIAADYGWYEKLDIDKLEETYQIMTKLEELLGKDFFEQFYNEQFRQAEAYASQWSDFYAGTLGGTTNDALISGISKTFKDASGEEIQKIVKTYYKSLSEAQQKELNDYISSINSSQAIGESKSVDEILATYGIPSESDVGKALAKGIEEVYAERDKKIAEYSKKYEQATSNSFIVKDYSDLTMEQLNQLMSQIAVVSEENGATAATNFEKAYREYTKSIRGSDLANQFASVDLSDVESFSNYAALVAINIGESSEAYTKFVELVNNSSRIVNRKFKDYNTWTKSLKSNLTDVESSFDTLSSAAEGKLSVSDAFDLVSNSNGLINLGDFYATADGLGMSMENIDKLQKSIVQQKKASLTIQLEQYKLSLQQLKTEIEGTTSVNLALWEQYKRKNENLQLYGKELALYQKWNAELKLAGKEQAANDYAERKKVVDEMPTAIAFLDNLGVVLDKTAGKAKKLKDAWKELLDWLEKIDKYAAIDSFMSMLESDITGKDFNIEFSTNVDEIVGSTVEKVNAMNQLVNANLAKSDFAKKSAESYREQLEKQFGKYVGFDEFGNLIENIGEITKWGNYVKDLSAASNVNEDLIESEQNRYDVLVDLIDKYREERKVMRETEQTAKDYIKQIKELNKTQLENIKTIEDDLFKLLQDRDQKVIDSLKERYDFMKEQDQEYLNSVKEAVDKERKIRDTSQDYDDLARQERKLQLLKMSGGSATEIQNLEREIAKNRQTLADQEIDNLLDELNQEQEIKQQKMDEEVSYLQAVQDAKVETMTAYNIEVRQIMSQSANDIVAFFKTLDETYITGTQVARELWEQELVKSVANAKAAMEYEVNPAIQGVQSQVNQLVESQDLSTSAFQKYANTVASLSNGIVSNIQTVTDTYLRQKDAINGMKSAYDEYLNSLGKTSGATSSLSGLGVGDGSGTVRNKDQMPGPQKYNNAYNRNYTNDSNLNSAILGKQVSIKNGNSIIVYGNSLAPGLVGATLKSAGDIKGKSITKQGSGEYVNYVFIDGVGWVSLLDINVLSSAAKRQNISMYAKGGLVDYTGPAWVDGSKTKPEAFLSSKDTANISALTSILSRAISPLKFNSSSTKDGNGDVYYQISINVDELGDNYTVDDLMSEMENKILSIAGKNSVIQIK